MKSGICSPFYRLANSGHWMNMRQRPSFPGFFQAKLYVNSFPKDTFIKLPVSRTPSGTFDPVQQHEKLQTEKHDTKSIQCL